LVEYDLDVIERLAGHGCTLKEIAAICGFKESRFRALRKEHPDIQDAIDKGKANLHKNLRMKQVEVAMDGNPQMLIFLGKAILEQSDRVEVNHNVQVKDVYEIKFGKAEEDSASEAPSDADDCSE
jgi:hypothetical protein